MPLKQVGLRFGESQMDEYLQITVTHDGLHKYRVIRGWDKKIVEQMAAAQLVAWNTTWQKTQAIESQRREKELRTYYNKDACKLLATNRTKEAEQYIQALKQILKASQAAKFDWNRLKDTAIFRMPKPNLPSLQDLPPEPNPDSIMYKPLLTFFEKVVKPLSEKKIRKGDERLARDRASWKKAAESTRTANVSARSKYDRQLLEWEKEKATFYESINVSNHHIDERYQAYLSGEPTSVMEKCQLVLSYSTYPDSLPQDFDLEYRPESKSLILDYALPSVNDIPRLKEVKYIQAKNEFKENLLPDAEFNRLYDDVLYQIALRATNELYAADEISAISTIVFNGWVTSIDKATGKEFTACILSLQTAKDEFRQLDLLRVEPRICFKSLKGIASPRLHSMIPVAPILRISRQDKRFVDSYEVAASLDEGTNLAAMDWEDFEHLVRELFQKEFASNGGEVRVTRASRDWGVDAVVFDPDPIRGGKIIIQAKRYTNTVDVSSVRDLYGTVINEGAAKGILVTTADYGAEAHEFARGKPLTLLNGNNLLHLLAKHGHRAKIDLKEARALQREARISAKEPDLFSKQS